MTDTDIRLDRLESTLAVHRLISEYAHAFDSQDVCRVTNIELGPTQVGGVYRDRFERRDGRWGMTERVIDLHYFTPIPNWTPAHGSETAPLVVPSR